eukprot:scaffold1122_cov50-Phaeocystis_antarctica.AAC.3
MVQGGEIDGFGNEEAAVAGNPVAWYLAWERRASQSRQARPEEAREPTSGTATGALDFGHAALQLPSLLVIRLLLEDGACE